MPSATAPPDAEFPALTASEQAALAARLGGMDILQRRLDTQARLEANPNTAAAGQPNIQRLAKRGSQIAKIIRAAGCARWGRRNLLAVRRVENTLRLRGLPAPFRGLRLLQLSDLHADIDPGMVPAIIRALDGWEYDAIVLTGDYRVNTFRQWRAALPACAELARVLRRDVPTFAVLGNHDAIEMVPALEKIGWPVLLNEASPWRKDGAELWIAGVDDDHTYDNADVARARAATPPDSCALLLSHMPTTAARAAEAGFAAQLSGHSHGGQICLPGGIFLLTSHTPRRLVRGSWEYHGMSGYTSNGAGASTVAARFFCPPEITRHTLEG